MTYKELQTVLKIFKLQGKTTIALNSKKEVLEAEFDRLTAMTAEVENTVIVEETIEVDFTADLATLETLKQEIIDMKQKYMEPEIEPSPVVEATSEEAPLAKVATPQPTPPKVISALVIMLTAFVNAIIVIVNAPLRKLTKWSSEVVHNYHQALTWWLDGFSPPSFA